MNKYHNLAKKFRKEIVKNWGKKCKEFDFGCTLCQAHRIVDDLENLGNLVDNLNNPKIRKIKSLKDSR